MIQLTPAALREIDRLRSRQHDQATYLRLGLCLGACAPWSYTLEFQTQPAAADQQLQFGHICLIIAPDHLPYLADVQIDYSEDLMGGAFRFDNPQAKETCQCGQAFAI